MATNKDDKMEMEMVQDDPMPMEFSFQGQTAIITGAGRGLGRSYALELARRGANVVVNDIGVVHGKNIPWAAIVADEIKATGGTAVPCTASVMTPEGGQALTDLALDRFGSVDIVINNAGFLRPGNFEEMADATLKNIIDVHLMAAFHVTVPAWKIMIDRGYGRVVMTGSGSTFGHPANSNYVAAKAGIFALAQTLALEGAGHGIGVNTVLPVAEGKIAVDTPLVGAELPRLTTALEGMIGQRPPQTVAHLVTYLASRECKITGRAYSAVAGRYARVFLGITKGWMAKDIAKLSAEEIAAHMDEINDLSDFMVPTRLAEELESVSARIKIER